MDINEFDLHLFGQKLKKLRKAQGLSQEDLAARINKTVDSISNIERGISAPHIKTLCCIAAALDTPLYILLQTEPATAEEQEKEQAIQNIIQTLQHHPAAVSRMTKDFIGYILTHTK